MTSFSEALKNAGITPTSSAGYDKKTAGAFTLEMKLYEMKEHVAALRRIHTKYLSADGEDQFDYIDSLANRYGYMVIAFQDIIATIIKLTGRLDKNADISIRRAIAEFQSLFEAECESRMLDDAVTSFADRNEVVHAYENYRSNMDTILENIQNYQDEYEEIQKLIWDYCKTKNILAK
ncbi:MAG: hypothetical protein PHV18_02240 [Lachnospiraceae bacterium]|nr:hypothetical protein [Lachnospiraceae bacterium]